MVNASQKRYDKKVKLTRILLGDYLVLKELSVQLGVSMAEALHKIIIRQAVPEPEHAHPTPVLTARSTPVIAATAAPVTAARSTPVLTARSTPVIAATAAPVIAVNGNKAGIIVIKPKGGKVYV